MAKDLKTEEIEKSADLYGYTLKINDKKDPSHEDYVPLLQKLSSRIEVLSNVFEDRTKRGDKTKLHVHGIFRCNKNPYLKPILNKGVHIKVEKIYNLENWRRYCLKNTKELDRPYPDPLF